MTKASVDDEGNPKYNCNIRKRFSYIQSVFRPCVNLNIRAVHSSKFHVYCEFGPLIHMFNTRPFRVTTIDFECAYTQNECRYTRAPFECIDTHFECTHIGSASNILKIIYDIKIQYMCCPRRVYNEPGLYQSRFQRHAFLKLCTCCHRNCHERRTQCSTCCTTAKGRHVFHVFFTTWRCECDS